jgi:hypothetical protein
MPAVLPESLSLGRSFDESKTVTISHPRRSRLLSFYCKIDVYLPIGALQMSVPIQNTSVRIARISKNHITWGLEGAKLLD